MQEKMKSGEASTYDEAEKLAEEEPLRRAKEFAVETGRLNYLQLTNPEAYEAEADDAVERANELKKQRGKIDEKQITDAIQRAQELYGRNVDGRSVINSITGGIIYQKFPHFDYGIAFAGETTVRNPGEYLKNLRSVIDATLRFHSNQIRNRVDLLKRGLDYEPTPSKKPPALRYVNLNPDEAQAKAKIEEEKLDSMPKEAELSLKKHAEGFGMAALNNRDTAVAIDNLDAAGLLKPEVMETIKKQIAELQNSSEPVDHEKYTEANQKLQAIKE